MMTEIEIEIDRLCKLLSLSGLPFSFASSSKESGCFTIGYGGIYKVVLTIENNQFVINGTYFQNLKLRKEITSKVEQILLNKTGVLSVNEQRKLASNNRVDSLVVNAKNKI